MPEKRKPEEPASAEERTSGSSSSAGGPPSKESSGKRSRMEKDKDRYKDRDKVAESEKEDAGGDCKPESSKSSKSKCMLAFSPRLSERASSCISSLHFNLASIKLAPLPSIPRKSNNTNATRSSGPPSPKASTSKPSSPNVSTVALPSGSSRSSSGKDKAKSKSKSPPAPLQQQQREQQQQQRQTTPAAPFPPPPPTADENWTSAIARSHVPRFREESVGTFEGHTGEVCLATWNPEQLGSLATGGGDATLRLWDFSHPSLSSSSHPGQRRVGSSSGGNGSGWKLDAPPVVCKHLPATTDRKYLTSIDFSPTATLIGTTSYDGIARLWTSEGELHGVLTRHAGTVFKIKFNPRGDVIATCGSDGSVCLWDALSAKLKQAYEFHSDTAVDLDWMDNDILASASMDKTIQIQRVGRSTPVCTFRGHTDEVNRVLWQPRLPNATGPRLLASCSDDANVRVWSLEDGGGTDAGGGEFERKGQLEKYCRGVLKGHEKEVYTMAFGPPNPSTGKSTLATYVSSPSFYHDPPPRLADQHLPSSSGSFDHTIRLWDLSTVSCTHVLRAHTDSVFSLSFSPSGRHLASAGWDKLLVLWDLLAADNSDASSSSGIVSKVGGKRAKPVRQCTTRGSIFEVEWSRFGGALAVAMDNREVLVVDVGEFE